MELECSECEELFEVEEPPFEANVTCPHCKAVLETGMDIDADGVDGVIHWVMGKKGTATAD